MVVSTMKVRDELGLLLRKQPCVAGQVQSEAFPVTGLGLQKVPGDEGQDPAQPSPGVGGQGCVTGKEGAMWCEGWGRNGK